jgi:hypothetical protein
MAKLYSQNSVFLRGAECHCRVAEFLLHKYKRMIKRKFRSSNTLLNSTEYAITRKEHLKVHKIEIFFGFDFEICIISLLVMSKY